MKRLIATFVLLSTMPVVAAAGDVRAHFTVSAVVAPRVSIETVSEPLVVSVSEADVSRGYVEVASAYRVRNNDPAGYIVRLEPRVGLAASVEVAGLASPVVMRNEVVEVTESAATAARDLSVRYRILLGSEVPPGVYALPVRLTVVAL